MLQTTNLCKAFGTVNVIDSINLSIKQDEVVSLLGPNGAGKTTMVNLISGHLLPSSGNITFYDEDITYAQAYKRINLGIARNFQMTSLFQDNTVIDNVRICLFSIYGYLNTTLVPADFYNDITDEAMQILEQFGISEKRNLLAVNLPEGDKKVLDTALAFALKSKLLLLDEPTSGVATNDKFKVMDIVIDSIKKEHMSCLIIEHDMDIVKDYADRLLVINEGNIIADGMPSDVLAQNDVKEILFGVKV